MTPAPAETSASWCAIGGVRWSGTSWFAGAGLQEAPAAAVPSGAAHGQAQAQPSQPHDSGGIMAVGGARAQSRFSGKTAIPIDTWSGPMSTKAVAAASTSRSAAAAPRPPPAAPHQQPQPQPQPEPEPEPRPAGAAASLPAGGMHGGWSASKGVGHTVDGSVPASAASSCGSAGEHVSRWVFDAQKWQWVLRGQADAAGQAGLAPSDKHQLAARRWGDGRDVLAAAVQQQAGAGGSCGGPAAGSSSTSGTAGTAGTAPAPAKRQRIHISAMTGDSSDEGFAAVGGLQKQKEQLLEQVVYPLAHPKLFSRLGVSAARGVLLHGPPGSGKTHLVRALAAEARMPIVCLNGGECVGEDAEKKLRSAFNTAKSQQPCLLLLDELDAMAPCRQHSHSEHERQATARLLAAIDELRRSRARVGLVGATNRRAAVDAALRRAGRLDAEIALGALGQRERLEVLQCCTRRMPLDGSVQLAGLAAQLRGYVAADVAAVCSEAALLCAVQALQAAEAAGKLAAVEQPEFLASLRVTASHFEATAQRLGPAVLRGLAPEVPDASFDHIGGLQEAKDALRELVDFPLAHGELMAAYGLPPPCGALLYGPPGCGKTLLAKAAAAQCGANFISVRGPELLQKWLGESEAAVRRVFETARQAAPCLVFFDEIDSIACRRGSGGAGATAGDATAARVLNQLLVELDGMADRGGVFVLAATNRPEALDPALLRPGRLDHLVRVPLPDHPARLAILRSALRRCPLSADVDLAELAGEATEGMSGADLAEVCRRAGMAAIRELVAAEEAALAALPAAAAQATGSGGAAAAMPEASPLQRRHLAAALASMRRSVSEAESQRHAVTEQRLRTGSLPAPEATAEQQQQQVMQVVQRAVQGSVQRQVGKLQRRVEQLEELLRSAGLEVPLPLAEP